jgi:hypothetical protein
VGEGVPDAFGDAADRFGGGFQLSVRRGVLFFFTGLGDTEGLGEGEGVGEADGVGDGEGDGVSARAALAGIASHSSAEASSAAGASLCHQRIVPGTPPCPSRPRATLRRYCSDQGKQANCNLPEEPPQHLP